jgi:hypothetical protein
MRVRGVIGWSCYALVLLLACAPRGRYDGPREAAFADRTGWTKLGERWVNYGAGGDVDVVEVGAVEGTFSRMMIAVEHSAVELHDVVVVFGDGNTFSPAMKLRFGRGAASRVIDLPGGSRVIRRVEFRYRNLPRGGRAQVELWAK